VSAGPDTGDAARIAEEAARASYGKLVAILAHRTRDIAAAEDALSEALLAALSAWPRRGVPANPEAWLLTAARNRLKNAARAGQVRRAAEPEIALRTLTEDGDEGLPDPRLRLLFVCAHPAIDPAARTPLMLQTVLGIDAARIAQAFLAEPAAMSQRLVRAKARIRDAGLRFELPGPEDLEERLAAVLDAVYAAFGRGWDDLERPEAPGLPHQRGDLACPASRRADARGARAQGPPRPHALLHGPPRAPGATRLAPSCRSTGRTPGCGTAP
jgi:RNA polymerase sigma-70 factor, ECF subfamily